MTKALVLASASPIRRTLLGNAGLAVTVDPAAIDEGQVKQDMRSHGAAVETVAIELAAGKAKAVAARHPDALIIGADQILDAGGGEWFDKPPDRAAAARQLAALAGRSHQLVSAVAVVESGQEVWRVADAVTLHMRPLTPEFIASYLDRAGSAALGSVGAYQLEGLGAQLFTRIEGDYFTVLGLPLLPLLAFLRQRGIIA
ncbi:MAG TPA: Maf family nucleotide pyrophosphatase [Alphaproteobacteria bacterium]